MEKKEIILPASVKDKLPSRALEICREALSHAWEQQVTIGESQHDVPARKATIRMVRPRVDVDEVENTSASERE